MLGSDCPLNNRRDKEEFMKAEVEEILGKPINELNIKTADELRKEFCKLCKNIFC
ncbi:MAG: hypothetical protein QXK49_01840 [Candidatus Aenigmatarchaeota archaeon]